MNNVHHSTDIPFSSAEGTAPPSATAPPASSTASRSSASEDEAQRQQGSTILTQIFDDSQPHNALSGVAEGALEAMKGVALGVGCLTACMVAGVKEGTPSSIVKGAAGGIASLVGMSLYGSAMGVKKVVQGIKNTPDALNAASEGDMIWDEALGTYVKFDLPIKLSTLPPTDDDLFDEARLRKIKSDKDDKKQQQPSSEQEETQQPSGPSSSSLAPGSRCDYYAVLGVAKTATRSEIRKAFTMKALELHPDKNPSPLAPKEFQRVSDAYRVLSDQVQRARYDAGEFDNPTSSGDAASTGGASGGRGGSGSSGREDESNPIEDVFAGAVFHPWIGRLRYLLFMHPHMQFTSASMAAYEERKHIRAAGHLASLCSRAGDMVDIEVRHAAEDMVASSKVGCDIVSIIATEYLSAVRQYRQAALIREADRLTTAALHKMFNVASVLSNASSTALHAFRKTAGEDDLFGLMLAACTSDIQTTAATAAYYVLIDASVSQDEVKAQRAVQLERIANTMMEVVRTHQQRQLAAITASPSSAQPNA